ncbi:MAG TPA: ATP-binding cassette domain-containing protein, partial [Cellvibrio sp.]
MTTYEVNNLQTKSYEVNYLQKSSYDVSNFTTAVGEAQVGHINAEQISIHLGQGAAAFEAVQSVDFTIAPGEFVCVLGPSGCGKSTLLGALAGHITPSGGSLKLDGNFISGPSP